MTGIGAATRYHLIQVSLEFLLIMTAKEHRVTCVANVELFLAVLLWQAQREVTKR